MKTNPQFIQSIQSGLRYWQKKTKAMGPTQLQWLDTRRHNLHQAIIFGLNQPETWEDTAKLLLQTFDFSEWHSYWQEWVSVFEQALTNAPEKETGLYGRLQNRLGQLYRLDNQLPLAKAQHQAALALAQQLQDEELLAITYNCIAEFHLSQKNVELTKANGQAALELTRAKPELRRLEAFTHRILGQIEGYTGNYTAAIKHYQHAGHYWREVNNHIYLARSLTDLGNAYVNNKEFSSAEKAYEEAGEIFASSEYMKDKAIVYLNLGVLHYRQEAWPEAEAAFLQINPISLQEQKEFGLLAQFYNNVGNVYLKMAQWGKASDYLTEAIKIFRQRNVEDELGNSLGTIASVYVQLGDRTRALHCFEEALALLAKFPESAWAQRLSVEFRAEYQRVSAMENEDCKV